MRRDFPARFGQRPSSVQMAMKTWDFWGFSIGIHEDLIFRKKGYQEVASFFADSFAVINSGKETFLMTLILKDLQIEWQKDLIDL